MLHLQFLRSNRFRLASALGTFLAVFVTLFFGFIYWKLDDYLIARSDRMIAVQLHFFSKLPAERLVDAIDDHLGGDSRGVLFAGLFDANGNRLAGNIAYVPSDLKIDDSVQSAIVARTDPKGLGEPLIRAIGHRLKNGQVLVIGRNVDETREISHVVGEALALGLLCLLCLCLVAGVWLSVRTEKRVEEVNQRVRRIVAGDLRERLPYGSADESFSRLAVIVNGMLDEMETMINAVAGVGNDIAHDLRTPLTRARLTLERGRNNATTLEQLQQVADKAISGIDQSLSIITALLRLTEIENSRRSAGFDDVRMHDMLREVCDIYEPIAEDKKIKLGVKIVGETEVRGDRDLLFEAVANLVDNAIKFTPEAGKVDIELVHGNGETIVRVTDTGPGINQQETQAVLRRFYRSDKIRNTPGVGLGLNLVAAIAKLHGFRLVVYPGPGGRVEMICPDRNER